MNKPEMIETKQPRSQLENQLQIYFLNLHSKLMNGNPDHEVTEQDRKAETALDYAYQVLERNDQMCDMLQSEEYATIKEGEDQLKGKAKIGKIFCIDGRIARIYESFAINTWEKAAGLIRAERRVSDGKLIPSSSSFCESIAGKVDFEQPDVELLEINTAHYDSTNSAHGCAAINLIKRALTRNEQDYENAAEDKKAVIEEDLLRKSELLEILSEEDIKSIIETETAEDANLFILEKVNGEAITNYYNTVREQNGLEPLKRVAISALYDTATMGIELRHKNEKLSSTNLTNKYKNEIEASGIGFASYKEVLSNQDVFLDFSKKLLELERALIKNKDGKYSKINDDIDTYIDHHLQDLSNHQKQALRFKLLRKVGFQYLTGLSQIPESGHPNHPFSHHNEAYIAISAQGQFVGKYDLAEQQFGSSSEDIETAIDETRIANLVMDTNQLKVDQTRVAFICTSASRSDWQKKTDSFRRAKANNADMMRGIAKNDKLKQLMKDGKIIPIPVLLDEKRRVLEIPDHSVYF